MLVEPSLRSDPGTWLHLQLILFQYWSAFAITGLGDQAPCRAKHKRSTPQCPPLESGCALSGAVPFTAARSARRPQSPHTRRFRSDTSAAPQAAAGTAANAPFSSASPRACTRVPEHPAAKHPSTPPMAPMPRRLPRHATAGRASGMPQPTCHEGHVHA